MSGASSWLVGAFELFDAATIVVDGINNAVIPAGVYYLRDDAPALSLLDAIETAVAPFMLTPSVFVGLDRRIRVTAGLSFTWSIPPELEDILGFGLSIPLTTSATAAAVSSHLWSPGWPETTVGHPTGSKGWERPTRVATSSPSGLTMRATVKGSSAYQTGLAWNFVSRARAWAENTDDGAPGDFRRFWSLVLKPGRRWKLYRNVPEVPSADPSAATPVTWGLPGSGDVQGPYKTNALTAEWWRRSVKSVDTHTDVRLDATLTAELS